MSNDTHPPCSVEVDLVGKVKSCRACKWFWGGIPPYGPYPSFDWDMDYPEAFRQPHPQKAYKQKPSLLMQARAPGYHLVEPAIMHGCRKAPIMTIGINPNMTSYFASINGARWCYPYFEDPSQYAYYYRYQTIFQESFSLDFIKDHIRTDTAIRATKPGWLLEVNRCKDHRWMQLIIQYESEAGTQSIELAWSPDERSVLLVEEKNPEKDDPSFRQGDIIAAKLQNPTAEEVPLYENAVGYYQRFIPILDRLSDHIKSAASSWTDENEQVIENLNLRIGEDVSQHDMIGCASPGWSSSYDIPTGPIARKCVHEGAFAIQQILQSRPSVIVLVGKSTLQMFGRYYGAFLDLDYLEPDPETDGEMRVKDVFHLLRETCTRRKYFTIDMDNFSMKTRVIVCPHFSYYTNYLRQARLSAEAWLAFKRDFTEDVDILKKRKLVEENGYDNVTAVEIKNRSELQRELSVSAWNVLMAYYYDPNKMIADALTEEFDEGTISIDPVSGRLNRSNGACSFCNNTQWSFPEEGCRYGKSGDSGEKLEFYSEIIGKMTESQT